MLIKQGTGEKKVLGKNWSLASIVLFKLLKKSGEGGGGLRDQNLQIMLTSAFV